MFLTIPDSGILPFIILCLAVFMLANFYTIRKVEKLQLAYIFMLLAAFSLLHIVAYTCGGIRTGGILYYGVIILYAYMLLGRKGGQIFAMLFAVNVVYFYIISTYTDWTSFDMFKNDVELINEDFLINALFTFFMIATQGSFLQSGKNILIQTLEKSKTDLELKTKQLQTNNFLLKEYTKKLETSNRELDKFASVASHDLKAPLRAIGTLGDFIAMELDENLNVNSRKYLATIKNRVNRMDLLLDALLKYSRVTRMELNVGNVKTDEIIEKAINRFQSNKSIKFKVRNIFPEIQADKGAILNIFEILIENAIKFNDKKEIKIELWSEEFENEWKFFVKDNGPGIDKRFQEKIFVIFQTLNDRDTFESTGAGLAIAKRIVDNKGGTLSVWSEPGLGAEFCFTIPKVRINEHEFSSLTVQN